MTSLEEEKNLLETRRRIEANLERLAHASSSAMEVRPYFLELLQLAVNSLNARGGAVWLNEGTSVGIVAALEYESSGAAEGNRQEHDIRHFVQKCLSDNQTLVVMPGIRELQENQAEPANSSPFPFFYVPILLEGRAAAVIQIWLHQAGDTLHYKDYAAFLGTVSGHASVYLNHRQTSRSRALASSWQMQVRFHHDLISCGSSRNVLEVSANHLADLADAELGFACRRSSKGWKLGAASNADKVIPASTQALLLAAAVQAMESDVSEEGFVVFDIENEKTPEPVRHALKQCGANLLLGIFPKETKGATKKPPRIFLGALKQSRVPPSADAVHSISLAAHATAHLYAERELREAMPASGIFHTVARWRLLWRENPRRILLKGSIITILLLLILFLPWPWKISADCTVMPAHRLAAVAGTGGKLLEVFVDEGDTVRKGQVLARLDDRDLRAQLAAAVQSHQRWQVEEARAQALNNDAERKVAELNGMKEEENMKLLSYNLERTSIISPMNGIILTRELRNYEGENMETGKVLCEVADPSAYLLELQIRQQDLGDVQHALLEGKSLRVDFILHAHSNRKLHAEIRGKDSLSPAAEIGPKGSFFLLRTQFPGNELSLQDLKTGYTGKAKITLGQRPLWQILFTPFLNYMNVEWGV